MPEMPWRSPLWSVVLASAMAGCGGNEPEGVASNCPAAGCGIASDAANNDTAAPDSAQGDSGGCAPAADVTALLQGGELFFGYAALGTSELQPGCGQLGEAKEIAVSFTPDFTGNVVLSTLHPTTKLETVLEVHKDSCDGAAIDCSATAIAGVPGSRLTVPVTAGERYVAVVETADDEAGIFALGLHKPGVCEGEGVSQEITSKLLMGQQWQLDTSASTSSMRGSCAAASDDNPEARFTFVAPRDGQIAATTVHPDTAFNTLLHVRESSSPSVSYCDSPETERGCAVGSDTGGLGPVLRFDAHAGRVYDVFVDGAGAGAKGPATLTLGYASSSPATHSLQGCDHNAIQDQFAILLASGQSVSLKVDTVDAATAADTRLRIRNPDGTELFEADDEVACTFPPPAYSCPQYSFTVAAAGLYTLEVYVGTSENCADEKLVNYVLQATVDGQPSELILIKDQ